MPSQQHQRGGYLTSHSSVSTSIFCSCCSLKKKQCHQGGFHASLVLWENMQGMLLYSVTYQHWDTTRLPLITNKESAHISRVLLRLEEWQLCRELWHTFGSHHFNSVQSDLRVIGLLDAFRLKMTINKIDVFVYFSADSRGNKRTAGVTMLWTLQAAAASVEP